MVRPSLHSAALKQRPSAFPSCNLFDLDDCLIEIVRNYQRYRGSVASLESYPKIEIITEIGTYMYSRTCGIKFWRKPPPPYDPRVVQGATKVEVQKSAAVSI